MSPSIFRKKNDTLSFPVVSATKRISFAYRENPSGMYKRQGFSRNGKKQTSTKTRIFHGTQYRTPKTIADDI